MKKFFFSLLAIAAIASCAKTEDIYTEGDSEIKIAPVTAISTKADYLHAIDGIQYPLEEEFRVNAYWNGNETNKLYLDNVVFTRRGQYWAGQDATYYWPKNGTLSFACYSPATVPYVTHEVADDLYKVAYAQEYLTEKTIDFMIAPITAPYTAQTATENVSVVFEHTLSWITLKVKAANATAAQAFTVKGLTINGVSTTANLEAKMADGVQYDEWSGRGDEQNYAVFAGSYDLTTTAEILENTPNGTVVIPQVPTTLTIDFVQNELKEGGVVTTPALSGQTITIPLELDNENDNKWHPAKHYIYTVVFDLDEILINPSVADWEDVVVEDKEDTDNGYIATVADETELKAALAARVANIQLTAPIALTSQLAVDYNVAFVDGGFTGSSIVVTGGVVSFENVAFANGNGTDESSVYVRTGNTDITFDNCTFADYQYEAIQYTAEGGDWVCINNCTFAGDAKRDVHLQVNAGTNAELKLTNNTFNGTVNSDSYVVIDGFQYERMILANNVTKNPARVGSTIVGNVKILDGRDELDWYLDSFVVPTATVNTGVSTILNADVTTAETIALGAEFLDGKGHEIVFDKSEAEYALTTTGSHIKNVNLIGYNGRATNGNSIRGILIKDNTYDVVINNVTVNDFGYAINTAVTSAAKNTLTVVDSQLEGWTSFAGFTKATFINTHFTIGNYYAPNAPEVDQYNANFKPQITTVLDGCTFEKEFYLDVTSLPAGATVTFKNCNVDGVKLTADNFEVYMNYDGAADRWADVKFE